MLVAFAAYNGFVLYQMGVKSAFLNGFISEEVYVKQPPSFENETFPNHVFDLTKALYGLKQAPRAWYERSTLSCLKMVSKEEKLTQPCSFYVRKIISDCTNL